MGTLASYGLKGVMVNSSYLNKQQICEVINSGVLRLGIVGDRRRNAGLHGILNVRIARGVDKIDWRTR